MSDFVEYLKEVFALFGPIEARRMFGGYGLYYHGVMFGLVADDALYLKADETTAKHFTSRGLKPFEYAKSGKVVKMSYYQAPEEVVEDAEAAKIWAERAYEVALRTKTEPKGISAT